MGNVRIRYRMTDDGTPIPFAKVYGVEEHGIRREAIDHHALMVIRRLRKAGHTAYVVGGAVRDLLLGKHPKDFDIVTCATPGRIKRLFPYARVIGRRFRLVHVYVTKDEYVEVTTFRSARADDPNAYGSIEEDAFRRDFTVNALYYDPFSEEILDFVDGFTHVRERRLVPIIPLDRIFEEDPVRMLRAVKYHARMELEMPKELVRKIRDDAWRLEEVSTSRLTEEIYKILACGEASSVWEALQRFHLFDHLLPHVHEVLGAAGPGIPLARWHEEFERLDRLVREGEVDRDVLILPFARLFVERDGMRDLPFKELYRAFKEFLRPFTPPNRDVDAALRRVLRKRRRKRRRRRRVRHVAVQDARGEG
ncbi:poly(A) polymerase [Spirochaeta thermophila DSM 6578]|uniref:Poly(A) polymerase n=2 Tax=Winmispira thermophila TaxID=154 RepID=G0GB83_WINT7|nr:poly(A) polymerase [Spirochaeta thermophila DSM 6578]